MQSRTLRNDHNRQETDFSANATLILLRENGFCFGIVSRRKTIIEEELAQQSALLAALLHVFKASPKTLDVRRTPV